VAAVFKSMLVAAAVLLVGFWAAGAVWAEGNRFACHFSLVTDPRRIIEADAANSIAGEITRFAEFHVDVK
jgi:hypothetical protein